MANPQVIEFSIPKDVVLDSDSDRTLHRSIKNWNDYESLGLAKTVFFKRQKITSKIFLGSNPLVCKVKQSRKIVAYGYQRANRAKEHGEPLIRKEFKIRESLATALKEHAKSSDKPETEIAEIALAKYLEVEL